MASWAEFEKDRSDLATAGRALLYQFGVGLGFLATVRRDGGPRVHPMCPVIHGGGMYAFIVPGPKQADLHRDGRYALHSFPCEDNEDAFYCTGRAEAEEDEQLSIPVDQVLGHPAAAALAMPGAFAGRFAAERSAVFTPRRTAGAARGGRRQAARRWTSQTVAAMSSADSASCQPPWIHWNGQNRLAGW